jgi:hypothetical protein
MFSPPSFTTTGNPIWVAADTASATEKVCASEAKGMLNEERSFFESDSDKVEESSDDTTTYGSHLRQPLSGAEQTIRQRET